MTNGQRIAKLRNLKHESQSTLAKFIHVSPSTIGMWETDQRAIKDDDLSKLADHFEVSIDYLLGRNEAPLWATQKDSIDLKSFLDGNMNPNMNYDGEDLTTEQNERLKLAMTQIFWEERQKDKKRAENHGDDKGIK